MPTLEVWMTSPFVECKIDFEESQDIEIDDNLIAWFDVKFNLPETDEEKKERTKVIQEQIQKGVLDSNGVPHGVAVPPEMRRRLYENNMRRSNQKHPVSIDNRPYIKEVNGKKQVVLSPLASQIEKQLRNGRKGNRR